MLGEFHSDTFFTDTRLTRRFECGSYTYVDVMKGKRKAPSALRYFTRDDGALAYLHLDNVYEEVLGECGRKYATHIASLRLPLGLTTSEQG